VRETAQTVRETAQKNKSCLFYIEKIRVCARLGSTYVYMGFYVKNYLMQFSYIIEPESFLVQMVQIFFVD